MYIRRKVFSNTELLKTKEFGNKENKAKKNEWKLRQRIKEEGLVHKENARLQGMADEINSKKKWYQSKIKPEAVTEEEVLDKLKDGQRVVQEKMQFQNKISKGQNASRTGETIKGSEDLFMKSQGRKKLGRHTPEVTYITNDIHGVVNGSSKGSKARAHKLGLDSPFNKPHHISGSEAQRRIIARKTKNSGISQGVKDSIAEKASEIVEKVKEFTPSQKKGLKLSRNQKLGAAALGTAAVIGAGTYAYKKHKKSKEEKK